MSEVKQDRLNKLMDDYRNNRITESSLGGILHLMKTNENDKYYRNAELLKKHRSIEDFISYDEEAEKARSTSIRATINLLKTVLTGREFDVLYKYAVEMRSQAEIAEMLGVDQSTISRTLKGIHKKCMENAELVQEVLDICSVKALASSARNHRKDMGYARHKICYPSEYLCKISAEPKWYKQKMILKTQCVCPEYFSECFEDAQTKCSMCLGQFGENECSRKAVN